MMVKKAGVMEVQFGPWNIRTKNRFVLFLDALIRQYNENRVSYASGSIAYFFTLSLFPFIMFLNSLLGLLNLNSETLIYFISPFFPPEVVSLAVSYNDYIANISSGFVLTFSILISIYSASRGVNAINITINSIYRVKKQRDPIREFILSIVFTIAVGLLALLMIAAIAAGGRLFEQIYLAFHLPTGSVLVLKYSVIFLAFVVMFLVFSLLYVIAPYRKMKFRQVLAGSLFSTAGVAAISIGVSIYVGLSSRFSLLYGSIGAIIVLMLWFYLFGNIISIGALLNHLIEQIKCRKKSVQN